GPGEGCRSGRCEPSPPDWRPSRSRAEAASATTASTGSRRRRMSPSAPPGSAAEVLRQRIDALAPAVAGAVVRRLGARAAGHRGSGRDQHGQEDGGQRSLRYPPDPSGGTGCAHFSVPSARERPAPSVSQVSVGDAESGRPESLVVLPRTPQILATRG